MTGRGRGATSRPEGGGGLRGWVEVGMARVRGRGATSRPEGGGAEEMGRSWDARGERQRQRSPIFTRVGRKLKVRL